MAQDATSGTVTVLFTDLVGSTEMTFGLDGFDEIRRAHDALLYATVEANGGVVVKGLGDGVMATFLSAAKSVATARKIQQVFHRQNRRGRGPELSLKIGLSIGDVIYDGLDCFGAPVIEAARLCAIAQGDQILATEMLRAVARDTGVAPVGALELKGIPEPVDVVEIVWERVRASETPLPPRLALDDPAFVGREDTLNALDAAFTRVRASGERGVMLLAGEPGGGKTTVVTRALRTWHGDGATVAMGRCEEDVRAPYRPFIEALSHLVDNAPIELLEAHAQRHGANALPIAPRTSPPRADPPRSDRHRSRERTLLDVLGRG